MFCICLQVNKQQDLLVLLKFGLMSNANVLAIKHINRLLQEGAMTQSICIQTRRRAKGHDSK